MTDKLQVARVSVLVLVLGLSVIGTATALPTEPHTSSAVTTAVQDTSYSSVMIPAQQGDISTIEICGGSNSGLQSFLAGLVVLMLYGATLATGFQMIQKKAGETTDMMDGGTNDSIGKLGVRLVVLYVLAYIGPQVLFFATGIDLTCITPGFPPGA